ncbi:lasso peptide biosynthesis PqqD family chaperone [Paenibacillus harenae]|uniref:Lasso peptide biosynthesis PqqD family chaperone n=1 Tax=Paenibacillus harenae TaxID=306543 RepID=A0ABT9U599_PAEHA|nr:lasso peptide biosynthesis PqqD family chaperone [Paenibacillus harenae]MDQ0063400.1 hypothetical protein [Paenibacillus harenae]MDQ0114814.1 hypothetical protein [Paenibacillus harenae]
MSKFPPLTPSDRIAQCPGNIVSDMDGEKVMLSVQNGKYYNLGAIGGRIWELLPSSTSVNELINKLTIEYDVDQTTCEQQAMPFLNHLLQEGLIRLAEEAE